MLGVLSLMKKITGDNPESLFRGIPLRSSVWDALNGKAENDCARLLRYVEIYEKRDPRQTPPDIRSHLDNRQIDNIYKACGADADAMIDRMDTPT